MSRDNVPFRIQMTVLFSFNPASALKNAAAVLVRGGDNLLQIIVRDYTSQGLRRLAAKFKADELCSQPAMSMIERNLTRFLIAEMRVLGLAPLKSGGLLIKETIPPEKFERGMVEARRLEMTLQVLAGYPRESLIQQATQVGLVTGLEELKGNLNLFSTLAPLESLYPALGIHQIPHLIRNGQHRQNGH